MIDLHCHILPGVDDGAGSPDEALSMARIAVADGIRRLVATPHQSGWDGARCRTVAAQVQNLQRELNVCDITLTLYCGVEMYLSPDLLQRTGEERAHTLNRSRYILLELPATDYPLYTDEVIFALQLRGLTPVLAHPERNLAVQDDPNHMLRLVERGVLGQLTASSLLDSADRRSRLTAERLLEHGLAHILATDGHDAAQRTPRLAEGVRAAARIVGRERAESMVTEIPEAILADREISSPPPRRVRAPRWWLRLPWQTGKSVH
jgi:protein-tyrosine phosphatase